MLFGVQNIVKLKCGNVGEQSGLFNVSGRLRQTCRLHIHISNPQLGKVCYIGKFGTFPRSDDA